MGGLVPAVAASAASAFVIGFRLKPSALCHGEIVSRTASSRS